MPIDAIQPPLYPVTSAPGAIAALRATVGAADRPEEAEATPPPPPADRPEPGEVALAAVQAASEAWEELRRAGRELRFQTTDEGVLRIEVYDGTGHLVRSIPPNEALALASGEASWQA